MRTKSTTKLTSLLLALCMMVSMLPAMTVTASAAEEEGRVLNYVTTTAALSSSLPSTDSKLNTAIGLYDGNTLYNLSLLDYRTTATVDEVTFNTLDQSNTSPFALEIYGTGMITGDFSTNVSSKGISSTMQINNYEKAGSYRPHIVLRLVVSDVKKGKLTLSNTVATAGTEPFTKVYLVPAAETYVPAEIDTLISGVEPLGFWSPGEGCFTSSVTAETKEACKVDGFDVDVSGSEEYFLIFDTCAESLVLNESSTEHTTAGYSNYQTFRLASVTLTETVEEEAEEEEAAISLPSLSDGKLTYDFTAISSDWGVAVNPTEGVTRDNDIRGITYDYTDGNWSFNSMTGASAYWGTAYLDLSANNGKWIALNIKVPEDGLYAVSLKHYIVHSYSINAGVVQADFGESDVHILPGGDIDTLVSSDKYNIGTVAYHGTKNNTAAETKLSNIWLDKGENILVFESVGTGYMLYPISLTIDGKNKLTYLDASVDKELLEVGETAKVTAVPSLLNGTELMDDECAMWYISSEDNVATVDAYGNVKAVGMGTAEIVTNAVYDGVSIEKSVTITVTDSSGYTSAEIDAPEKMYVGAETEPTAYLLMNSGAKAAVSENVAYSSSNEGVIAISDGTLSAVGEGEATVTAEITVGEETVTAEASITVVAPSEKSAPTIYTYAKREAALENISKYEWASTMCDAAVAAADKYAENYESYYNAVTAEGIPRSMQPALYGDPNMYYCRYCGTDIREVYGIYSWVIDPISRPWRVQCPDCKRIFPSNDFESFYELGLNERGEFDRTRALEAHRELLLEKGLIDESVTDPGEEYSNEWKAYYGYGVNGGYLINNTYTELSDVSKETYNTDPFTGNTVDGATWGVDDGFGYVPTDPDGNVLLNANGVRDVHAYIPCYNFWLWRELGAAVDSLSEAYLYTGDEKYGRAGAIILDRMADVFPDFDSVLYYSSNRYERYYLQDSYTGLGKVLGYIWDSTYLATPMAYATDAFYPMMEDSEVISFLSEKAKELNLDNDKSSASLIWQNWADGILRASYDGAQTARIKGNPGIYQETVTAAAISLASEPEKSEMLDWVYRTGESSTAVSNPYVTGGDINKQLIDACDRDGVGTENAASYNVIWLERMLPLAELTENEGELSLFENPKFKAMFTTEIPLVLSGNHHAQIGDSGVVAGISFVGDRDITIKGFKRYGTKEIAQYIYLLNDFSVDGLHYDIFEKNPERLQQEILAYRDEKSVIQSDMVTGLGYAVLRGGDGTDKIDGRKNKSDFWMYFGKNTGHGHHDTLNIGIEAYGLNLAPDLGYPEATSMDPNRLQWIQASISHNTVIVDEKNHEEVEETTLPLHFDSSDKVKLVDIDASEAYAQADNYRRTLVMVDVDDTVSYGVDFFRVTGGDKHTFSFHSQAENAYPAGGLEMTAQADENGEYVGTYAGTDVMYGNDPDTVYAWVYETRYPRGYTWLKNVRRDTSPEASFAVEFDVEDYRASIADGNNINLRMTQMNDFIADEVAIAGGHVPQTKANAAMPQSLDYVLVQREGDDLDSLFTTVYEPYKEKRYIKSIEAAPVTLESGKEKSGDEVRAVKVTHTSGRVDYIVYATNNELLYSVDGVFLFSGFVGVYSLNAEGECTYRYVNDGEIIGAATGKAGKYSGKVIGMSRELSTTNYIDVDFACEDIEDLVGRYIYVSNDAVENGAYKIENAEEISGGIRLYIDSTLIRGYKDAKDFDAGFVYNIAVGQRASVPLSFEDTEKFEQNGEALPSSIKLTHRALALAPREKKKLHASIKPLTAKDAALTWSTSDEGVVTVDENGRITAVSEGTAEITVSASNGVSDTCTVEVASVPLSSDGMWGYREYGDGVELIKYFGNDFNVVIPAVIINEENTSCNVIRIGKELFKDNTVIENATLSEGIKEIGESAFEGAVSLICIFTPESLSSIGSRAFYGCEKFNSVILYSMVTSIGSNAFGECPSLVIYCDRDSEAHTHAKYNKIAYEIIGTSVPEIVELEGVTYYVMGGSAYAISYDGSCLNLEIPDTVEGCPVVSVGEAFRESGIVSITLPESVTSLDPYAFYGCTRLSSITLPESLVSMGKYAFCNCSALESIKIPDGAAHIPEKAFSGCSSLSEVTLPAELTAVGANAFYGCSSLSAIELPENVEAIGDYAFYRCTSLSGLQLPEKVVSIGNYAFAYCSALTEIEIPEGVTRIYPAVFAYCENLAKVTLPDGVISIGSLAFRNCKSLESINLPDSITSISGAFYGCTALSGITLPSKLKTLSSNAFGDCAGITTVIIPESVSSIAEDAFAQNTVWLVYENSTAHVRAEEYGVLYMIYSGGEVSIETYTDENGVTYILTDGQAIAMSYDGTKTDVVIPETVNDYPVTGIGKVFKASAITSITLPGSIKEIKDDAFYNCTKLSSVTLSEGLEAIGDRAFYNCDALTEITVPEGVVSIGASAFSYCNGLETVTLPESLAKIESNTFASAIKLKAINLPEGLKTIGNYAFRYCYQLSGITLPESLESIGAYAFAGNRALTEITIPGSVASIGSCAFSGCTSLSSVTLNEGLKTIGDEVFADCVNISQLLVPASVSAISQASIPLSTVWVVYENSLAHQRAESYGALYMLYNAGEDVYGEIITEGGVTYIVIGEKATAVDFDNSKTSVTVPETVGGYPVVDIGEAFSGKSKLRSITLPETVTAVKNNAFKGCRYLTTVTLPESIASVGNYAFANCSHLETINLPDGVTSIGNYAFNSCERLKNITLPSELLTIGDYAFANCTKLEEIVIPDGVTSLGKNLFSTCTSLERIAIANSVKTIGAYTFFNCTSLTTVTIPESVTAINEYAFNGCSGIEQVLIPATVETIAKSSFNGNTLWLVYSGSYAHTYAENMIIPHFVIDQAYIPEIAYGASISGVVTGSDGAPVSGAAVEILYEDGSLKEGNVLTDENGKYTFTYAEVGSYTIRATDSEGNSGTEKISVRRMNIFDVFISGNTDIRIKSSYTVSGNVGEAATVTLTDTDGNVIASVTTDDGAYSFTNVSNGTYIVKAETENGTAVKEITVFNGNVTDVDIVIPQTSASIKGYVEMKKRDNSKHRRHGADIALYNSEGVAVSRTKTDEDGAFTFKGLPLGEYAIVAETHDMRPDRHGGGFDRSHKLEGYAYVNAVSNTTYDIGELVLVEENDYRAEFSGTVTEKTGGEAQAATVTLRNVYRHEVAKSEAGSDGVYTFKNVRDGLYFITARSGKHGRGSTVVVVVEGNVLGEKDIVVYKPEKMKEREDGFKGHASKAEAEKDRDNIINEKKWYDSLSPKEKEALSDDYVTRLNQSCEWISGVEYKGDGATLQNGGMIISDKELDGEKTFTLVLNVEKKQETEIGSDGIKTDEQFNQTTILDTAGGDEIIGYYDITLTKEDSDGEVRQITSVARDTDTTGKLRITMDIPEEYRNHKHYRFIHIHNGEAVTLVDLDDDPNTITFEVDRFSTFALTGTDDQLSVDGDVEEEIEKQSIIVGRTMVLGNSLAMNFYINAEKVTDTDKVVIEHMFADGSGSETVEKLVSECEPSNIGGNMYMITIDTIAAKEMADTITATVYNAYGQQISEDYSTTVRDYALALFNNSSTSDELKTVVVDMLNYGAEAQKFFGYNVSDLANSWFTDEHMAYASDDVEVTADTLVPGNKYKGTTLLLTSNIVLTGYFDQGDADISNMYAVAEFTDHYGNEETETIYSKDFNMSYGSYNYFGVNVTKVVVSDLKQPVKLIVYNEDGSVYDTLTFSIENYIAKVGDNAEQSAVSKALAKFAMAAQKYFNE